MKKQTFLVSMQDINGTQKDFYRFSCKKPETCKNQIIVAAKKHSIFPTLWKKDNISTVICYATPDGYNEKNIIWQCSLDEILA